MPKTARQLDREIARTLVPGIRKWNTYAGGTAATGHSLKFAAQFKRPRGGHSGLWHDLGMHRSPQAAASTAAKHYAESF